MMSILAIVGGTILTLEEKKRIITDGVIVIEDNTIISVGEKNKVDVPQGSDKIVLDSNHLVIPGLINTHTHLGMSLLRGYSDDKPLHSWLEEDIFPIEAQLKPEDVFIGTKLGVIESLLSGCTTVNSMYINESKEAEALIETGIRGVLGQGIFDWSIDDDIKLTESLISNYHGSHNDRIRICVAPHSPYTVSPEAFSKISELLIRENKSVLSNNKPLISWHCHVAETAQEYEKVKVFRGGKLSTEQQKALNNKSIFKYLEVSGVFNFNDSLATNLVAAHCVWVTDEDLEVMKRKNITVASNPVSNLKLGSGIAPVPKMLKKGITVGIGTDGTASNNGLDIFDSLRFMTLLHKGTTQDPTTIPARDALEMVTTNGAKMLGFKKLGRISEGYLADIVILDLKKPHLRPIYDYESHLAYAIRSSDVETVIVNGNVLLEHRKFISVDIEDLLEEVEDARQKLFNRLIDSRNQ